MVRIRVPATSANLGPGFDTLGMALKFYNYFEAEPSDPPSVCLLPATCVETGEMSLNPEDNLLYQSYCAYFNFRGHSLIPARLGIEAHIPLSRGLGSSSTAIVAGLSLANALSPQPLDKPALIPWAVQLEGHPDNVVPALMGGVQCTLSDNTLISLTWPETWGIILVIPPNPLETQRARAVMPKHYPVSDVIETLRGMAAWIRAIEKQDSDLFAYALQADRIHQPARSQLIPEFEQLSTMLKGDPMVIGSIISGAGSTCSVFVKDKSHRPKVIEQLKALLPHCKIIPIEPDTQGVTIQSAA